MDRLRTKWKSRFSKDKWISFRVRWSVRKTRVSTNRAFIKVNFKAIHIRFLNRVRSIIARIKRRNLLKIIFCLVRRGCRNLDRRGKKLPKVWTRRRGMIISIMITKANQILVFNTEIKQPYRQIKCQNNKWKVHFINFLRIQAALKIQIWVRLNLIIITRSSVSLIHTWNLQDRMQMSNSILKNKDRTRQIFLKVKIMRVRDIRNLNGVIKGQWSRLAFPIIRMSSSTSRQGHWKSERSRSFLRRRRQWSILIIRLMMASPN